jgi:plastocyanin
MIICQKQSLRSVVLVVAICLIVTSQAFATVHIVEVGNFAFTPTKTHITHGDTVRWVWASGVHTTTSEADSPKSWNSPTLSGSGQSFQVAFTTADGNGPFPYLCSVHPLTMKDTIFVTSAAVEIDGQSSLPGNFALEQNYPNPFNPTTTIRFTIPRTEEVELSIINVAGEIIEHDHLGLLHGGSYSIEWNGRGSDGNVAQSGVYFYRVKAGGYVETRKMVLLK